MPENRAIAYDDGLMIKALAVAMMVIHHSFGFVGCYVEPPAYLENNHVYHLAHCFKLCVPIFAFLTGWTYYHHKGKSLSYSLKKIVTLLSDYWLVVLPISLFAVAFCGYRYSGAFLWELIPAHPRELMIATWYLWYYILMMLAFPIFSLVENRQNYKWSLPLFGFLLAGIMLLAWEIPVLHDMWLWFPGAVCGYAVARFRVFEFCLSRIRPGLLSSIVALLPLGISLYTFRYHYMLLGTNSGYLAAPLFILAFLWCAPLFRLKYLRQALLYIGKYSMNIWFFHCIFFGNGTRATVQKALFISDNPLWIFSCVFLTSLALSVLITPLQKRVRQALLVPLWAKLGW